MTAVEMQERFVLDDRTERGGKIDWAGKKMANELLSAAYDEVDPAKAVRLRDCATQLIYGRDSSGKARLKHANFCRVRLCPICQWRRSLKTYAHTRAIIDAMTEDYKQRKKGLRWMFVTLTQRNVTGPELSAELDRLLEAWHRLLKMPVMNDVHGWYRGLEVTHNLQEDTYHPHYHILIAVNSHYSQRAIRALEDAWAAAWRSAMRLDYNPICDVRKVYGSGGAAVAEACKYSAKASEYILPDDWDLTVDTVQLLDKVLHKRRLIAYGKKMKEWHKKLNLDDEESGDLVHTDPKEKEPFVGNEVIYYWCTGYKQYIATL